MKTTQKPNTNNDPEQPQTTSIENTNPNNQNQNCHPKAPQNQQKQTDSQSQPNQVKRPPKSSQTVATTPTGTAEILSIHINDTQNLDVQHHCWRQQRQSTIQLRSHPQLHLQMMLQEDLHQRTKPNHQRDCRAPHDNHVCIKR